MKDCKSKTGDYNPETFDLFGALKENESK